MLPDSRLTWLILLSLGSGCTCGTFDPDTTRFACVSDDDCGPEFRCADAAGGRECLASCTTTQLCPAGNECRGGVCADLDECAASGRCGADGLCVNTPGSWECRCVEGFSGSPVVGAPASCQDVDECPGRDCGPAAVCANTAGSFECRCPDGTFGETVEGGATSCSTVDRCTTPGQCGSNATCVSTATSFTCACAQGYWGTTTTGTAATCLDADECLDPGACGANASCTNTTGSFSCACQSGYAGPTTTGMAATCSDVDECPTASCGANAHCVNSAGTYTCTCDEGYFGTPVAGGPAVCSLSDRCSSVDCGANASCTSGPSNYTCACNAGYQGASVMGAQATCSDLDECAVAGACGANALCTNTAGSYGCACMSGFGGAPTTGMPATCTPLVLVLGTAQATDTAEIPLSQGVPAGERLVLVVASANSGTSVSDARGNTWVRLVGATSCTTCGNAEVWSALLTSALQAGERVTVTANGASALWLASTGRYLSTDTIGNIVGGSGGPGGTTTSTPTVSTSAAVLEPEELLVGAVVTETITSVGLDGGFTQELAFGDAGINGVIGSRIATSLSGVQSFSAYANPAQRFSGAMATFYGVPARPPTALSLTHTSGHRSFTVSWTGGRGNGGAAGCRVEVQLTSATWISRGSVNCDADTVGQPMTLSSVANWYGGAWSTVPVRLVRSSDGVVLGAFPTSLTCAPRAASSVSTPTIDEDCDGTWDDHTCSTYTWVAGTVYSNTFTACTNATDTTLAKACAATNELENRYTEGMSTASSPATVFSSSSFGSGCQGPFTGATTWTCTPSNCSYR